MKKVDLTGAIYGRLTVIKECGRQNGKVVWECICSCGNIIKTVSNSLRTGNTSSCGCLKIESTSQRRKTHGMSRTRIYSIWCGIINRCNNKNEPAYPRYGGRGINVCDDWKNSFEKFFSDMGVPEKNLSLDRINNEKGYSKENCRWAIPKEQARNTRTNRVLEFNGETLCIAEWAERIGISESTLRCRIDRFHWSIEKAVSTPALRKFHR